MKINTIKNWFYQYERGSSKLIAEAHNVNIKDVNPILSLLGNRGFILNLGRNEENFIIWEINYLELSNYQTMKYYIGKLVYFLEDNNPDLKPLKEMTLKTVKRLYL